MCKNKVKNYLFLFCLNFYTKDIWRTW